MPMMRNRITLILAAASALVLASETFGEEPASVRAVVGRFCAGCHDAETAKGGLDLTSIVSEEVGRHPQVWEIPHGGGGTGSPSGLQKVCR